MRGHRAAGLPCPRMQALRRVDSVNPRGRSGAELFSRAASLARRVFAKKLSSKIPQDLATPVDVGQPSAVDTPAVGVPVRFHSGSGIVIGKPSAMEKEHFGNCLRRARETRDLSLSDVAQRTKVSRAVLEVLEKG